MSVRSWGSPVQPSRLNGCIEAPKYSNSEGPGCCDIFRARRKKGTRSRTKRTDQFVSGSTFELFSSCFEVPSPRVTSPTSCPPSPGTRSKYIKNNSAALDALTVTDVAATSVVVDFAELLMADSCFIS